MMGDPSTLRWAILGLLLTILVAIAPFRWRAARHASGSISYQAEGRWYFWSLRIGGLALVLVLMADLLQWPAIEPLHLKLPVAVRWCGLPLGLLGVVLAAWTLWHLGPNLTDTVITRPDHQLITDGPYRWIRHPFYVSTLLLVLGMSCLTANLAIAAIGLAVFGLLLARSRREEAHLIDHFGEAYRAYRRRTPAIWPRLFGS